MGVLAYWERDRELSEARARSHLPPSRTSWAGVGDVLVVPPLDGSRCMREYRRVGQM